MKDQILKGWVILENMAFSKAEILEQRKDICDLLEQIEKLEAEVSSLRAPQTRIAKQQEDAFGRKACIVCGLFHGGLQCPTLTPRAFL